MKSMLLWLIMTFVSAVVCYDKSLLCSPWSGIEQKLKEQVSQATCEKNEMCTAMTCVLHKYGYEMHCGLQLNPCENPASMELEVDIPKLNINSWKRKFYHGDTFSFTGGLGGEFGIQKKKDEFIISLTVHFLNNKNKSSPLLQLLPTIMPNFQYPVFQNVTFPIPPCASTQNAAAVTENKSVSPPSLTKHLYLSSAPGSSNCTIINSSCSINEICKQIDKRKLDGICVCNMDFMRDRNGRCIFSPTSSTTTEDPSSHNKPDNGSTNTSLLLTAILVPITVIFLIVGIVYTTIRFRICQHLRRRLRVQVYEHVLLGQDDEDEDDLSNPVA